MCCGNRFIGILLITLGLGALMALIFPAWLIAWIFGILLTFVGAMMLCK